MGGDAKVVQRAEQLYGLLNQHREEYNPILSNPNELEFITKLREKLDDVHVGLTDGPDASGEDITITDGCDIVLPEDEGFLQLGLDFQGFCPVTFTKHGGVCVPGNPQLGVVKYGEYALTFSTLQAMAEFMSGPGRTIAAAQRLPID